MNKEIVFLEPNKVDAVPFTTSEVISESARVTRHAVQTLIQNYESDLEEFGRVSFEMRPLPTNGGIQNIKVYHLNEEQAVLLMTYLKNTERVRAFKKELVIVGSIFILTSILKGISNERKFEEGP